MKGIENIVFDLLDQHIEECLHDDEAEKALIETYWEWWRALKNRVGTSSGYTGFSEYLFFRYILKRIEYRAGTSFKVEECTKDTSIFRSQQIILTHDVDIARFVDVDRQKTDIAVLSSSGTGNYQLVAAFELKVYITDRNVINDLISRLDYLGQHTDSLLFPIFFFSKPQYNNEVSKFCEKYPERAFIISNFPHRYRLNIKEAIDLIVKKVIW